MMRAGTGGWDEGGDIRLVRARAFHVPLDEPVRMSFGRLVHRACVLVEVECDDGTVGRGESWVNYPSWASQERLATLADGVAPFLVGRPVGAVREHLNRLFTELRPIGRQWGAVGPISQAISGAEVALWDAAARRLSAPLWRMLGGLVRDRVKVYASGLGPEGVKESVIYCLEQGFGAVKLRVGFGRDVDEQNLRTARSLLDPDISLMADANQAWSLREALEMAPILVDAGVCWVEEPLRDNHLHELELLNDRTGITIATGENLYGLRNFLPYVMSPAVSVLQPDISKVGGLWEALTIAHAAESAGKAVIPHVYGGAFSLAAAVQLAAVTPCVESVEYDIRPNALRDGITEEPFGPVAGVVKVPTGSGLGMELRRPGGPDWQTAEVVVGAEGR